PEPGSISISRSTPVVIPVWSSSEKYAAWRGDQPEPDSKTNRQRSRSARQQDCYEPVHNPHTLLNAARSEDGSPGQARHRRNYLIVLRCHRTSFCTSTFESIHRSLQFS